MRRILILLLTLLAIEASAQNKDYVYPLRDVQGRCVANFGEIRPGHFHMGVDIRTDGVEGKRVVAVADGFVSRIVVQDSGYGIGLYLDLKDGTQVVYGHLQRFRDDIERFAREERHRTGKNSIDCSFAPDRWPVRQGDLLAFSGNTGSSFGPHLHFEMREAGTGVRPNLVKRGIIRVEDTLPPRILRLHYVEADTLPGGVCVRSDMEHYDVVRRADGTYRPVRGDTLEVGRKGYFVIEVSDRRNGVNNRFGIWRLSASIDGQPYFVYRMDGVTFEQGRMSDAVSCYPMQTGARCEVIRVAQLEQAPDEFYPVMRERGLVRCAEGAAHRVSMEAEDDSGNRSVLEFVIRGRKGEFRAEADERAVVIDPEKGGTYSEEGWAVMSVPAHSLYEKTPMRIRTKTLPQPRQSGVRILSEGVCFLDRTVPMLHAATYVLRRDVPQQFARHTVMGRWTERGLGCVGGRYRDGRVEAATRTGGWMVLVADTEAPKIYTRYPKARVSGVPDLRRQSRIVFRVKDNFSGIGSFRMQIDGRWVPAERQPVRGEISHRFEVPPSGRMHTVSLRVTDGAGNTKTYQGRFFR